MEYSHMENSYASKKFSISGMDDFPIEHRNLLMEKLPSKQVIRDNLLRLIDSEGLTQAGLAERAGIQPGYLSELLDLDSKKRWNNDTLDRIANALNLPISVLFGAHTDVIPTQIGRISVIGTVEAGVWREADEWTPDEGFTLPIAGDEYRNCYALKVGGDSMNQFYAEGDFVIVCPLELYPDRLRPEEHVIVRRVKKDGSVEATVKELVIKDGKAELWPRSTNVKYKAPIDIHWPYQDPQKSGTELVEICGVVVTSYRVRRKL